MLVEATENFLNNEGKCEIEFITLNISLSFHIKINNVHKFQTYQTVNQHEHINGH